VTQDKLSEMDADEKTKPKVWMQTRLWAAGIALCLIGMGAWTYRQEVRRGSSLPRTFHRKGMGVPVSLAPVDLAKSVHGPESLEDALSTLESGDSWASEGIPQSSSELPPKVSKTKTSKSKAKKAPKAAKVATKVPEAAGPSAAEIVSDFIEKVSRSTKPKVVDTEKAEGDAKIDDVLDNLEALTTNKKKPKKTKVSEDDKANAQAIIRDALERMQSASPPEEDKDDGVDDLESGLRERMEALIAPDEERDSDPEIVKAKAIIKDAIKKMDSSKPGKRKAKESKSEPEAVVGTDGSEGDASHLEFAQRLKEEAAQKPDHDLVSIRQDFKSEFGSDSRRLLCSGCKLVTARLESELNNHDVHEAESPAHMIASKRRAIDATCHSFRHLHVVSGEGGPRFEAQEGSEDVDAKEEALGRKLCSAILEDAKFEVLSRLIRRKVPQSSLFHAPESTSKNWERMICAQRTRFCKRNEVREDEEDEEEEEL